VHCLTYDHPGSPDGRGPRALYLYQVFALAHIAELLPISKSISKSVGTSG
jgi:hypothetical protein